METLQAIKERRSIRQYQEKDVPQDILDILFETVRFSPSWKNSQTVRYTVVTNKETITYIANEAVNGFKWNTKTLLNTPVLVVISSITGICGYEKDGSYTTDKQDKWEMFDAGIATQTLCLAAHDLGLSTCILGIFNQHKIHEKLNLPMNQEVSALVCLGYGAEQVEAPARKPSNELVTYIK